MIDQAPLSNAKGARGMSEKHDEKCLNPGARPLIINAEHDLRKLHIEHKIRASFLLRYILFLASYPELRICLKPQEKYMCRKKYVANLI